MEDRNEDATALWVSHKGGSALVVVVEVDKQRKWLISLIVCTFLLNNVTNSAHRAIEEATLNLKVLAKHNASVNRNRYLLVQVTAFVSVSILRS
jgi:hypothetical protein